MRAQRLPFHCTCWLEFPIRVEEAFANLIERAIESEMNIEKMKMRPLDGFIHPVNDQEVMKGTLLQHRKELDKIPSPTLPLLRK